MEKKKLYELGYHLLGTLSQEKAEKAVSEMRGVIEDAGGEVFSEERPKKFKLSYTIKKRIGNEYQSFDTSHFGVLTFEATTDVADVINQKLQSLDTMLRFILLITEKEKEDTAPPKKRTSVFSKDKKEEQEDTISEDEKNKEIDEEIEKLAT